MGNPAREEVRCYHCGDDCGSDPVIAENKTFCCEGCRTVFELLAENDLCTYYNLNEHSGISPKSLKFGGRFAFLDDDTTRSQLLRFEDETQAHVVFQLPQMHCSSCVWLLEHLYRLDKGIVQSRTDFLRKELTVVFVPQETTLRKVVELLATIGYEPSLNLQHLQEKKDVRPQRQRIYRIAVAGFCFANIMLLSFPEYFHLGSSPDSHMVRLFSFLNLGLALPALLYSGGEFFVSAWQGIRARFLNIDIPLALSILITFGRSLYEILSGTGAGYLDSMTGIIFFMLVGRYFQDRTYSNLHFDRNFRSYFPISVTVRNVAGDTTIPLSNLEVGHRIIIRSQELIPADSRLESGTAWIDYSFVTGESQPVKVLPGSMIYAGGRQTGGTIELEVIREVEQSYLTNLWNRDTFSREKEDERQSFIHRLGRNFTLLLLAISLGSFLFWLPFDVQRGLNALTTVLIVACPCALLLSATFTHGSVLRIFSRNGFYLKNSGVIETLAKIRRVVFDKTGTITLGDLRELRFEGEELNEQTLVLIRSLVAQSNHPFSKAIAEKLKFCDVEDVQGFREYSGAGIEGVVLGRRIKLGSARFVDGPSAGRGQQSEVWVHIDGTTLGRFRFSNNYREGLTEVVDDLRGRFKLSVLSGDNDGERANLEGIFGQDTEMRFFQTPEEKMNYIESCKSQGDVVAMAGDGLNDAGALRASDAGIAVSDNVNNFSPACDAILEGPQISRLGRLLAFARASRTIILLSFGISLLYNIIGVGIAVQGMMSPVIAAILMPVSSISIVLFTTSASWWSARRLGLK